MGLGPGEHEENLAAGSFRFAVVGSRWNGDMADRLVDGAIDLLAHRGADPETVTVVRVPGAWEIPVAARRLAAGGGLDALVCTGVIIRGATPHFDLLAQAVTRALSVLQEETGLPVGFGLITADTVAQAMERSGSEADNKGWEAALAALEMAHVLRRLGA